MFGQIPANRFVEYKTGGHGAEMFKAHPELPGDIVVWYQATLLGKGSRGRLPRALRATGRTRLLVMADEPGGPPAPPSPGARAKKEPGSPRFSTPAFVNRSAT